MSENKEKKKKSKFKIGCLGAIIIAIILIILVILIGGGNSSKPTITAQMNKTFKMGNYNVKVSDMKNTNNITTKDGFAMSTTKDNYFIVNLTIENNSSNPIDSLAVGDTYQSAKVITLKENDKNFDVSAQESINAETVENINTFNTAFTVGNKLNPDTTYTSPVVINTPKTIKNGELILNIGGDKASIKF